MRHVAPQKPITIYQLRKLPLWGEQVPEDQINFQWPSEEFLSKNNHNDLKMRQLTIKHNEKGPISSIKCVLSDGSESPVFEENIYIHQNCQVFDFNSEDTDNRSVCAVAAKDVSCRRGSCVWGLKILKNSVSQYETFSKGIGKETTFKINENEELIGVYGVKSCRAGLPYFSSFSFIVAQKVEFTDF